MKRYLIYAMVYGTIGVCVGLAMAYVSKDVKYQPLILKYKKPMVETTYPAAPGEDIPSAEAVEVVEETNAD